MKIKILMWIFIAAFIPLLGFSAGAEPQLSDYLSEMDRLKKPAKLVVGCGHCYPSAHQASDFKQATHTHPDAWTVDRESWPGLREQDKPFWKFVGADENVDISDVFGDFRTEKPKKSPPFSYPSYDNKFDQIYLECVMGGTLNKPMTFYNSWRMLKEGGELIVEIHPSYVLGYRTSQPSPQQDLSAEVREYYEKSGVHFLEAYLSEHGFKDVHLERDAKSPENGRKGVTLVRATKKEMEIKDQWAWGREITLSKK